MLSFHPDKVGAGVKKLKNLIGCYSVKVPMFVYW